VIYGREYWNKLLNLQVMVDAGAISPEDLDLFQIVDTPEKASACCAMGLPSLSDNQPTKAGAPEIAKTTRRLSFVFGAWPFEKINGRSYS